MILKNKVLGYIFRESHGKKEVLVFDHRNDPDVNPQVPAGTIKSAENTEQAVLREIFEESGITFDKHCQYLGCFEYTRKDINEVHRRHVYTFQALDLPNKWEHVVSAGKEDKGLVFNYYWLELEIAKEQLVVGMGDYYVIYKKIVNQEGPVLRPLTYSITTLRCFLFEFRFSIFTLKLINLIFVLLNILFSFLEL